VITIEQIRMLTGSDVYDRNGDRIGSVGRIWPDTSGRPAWAGVRTGLFGLDESLMPLEGGHLDGGRLVVPFDRAVVKDAPNVDAPASGPLPHDEARRLSEHYGLLWVGAEPDRVGRPRLRGRRSIG
jgi:hypothetical protein